MQPDPEPSRKRDSADTTHISRAPVSDSPGEDTEVGGFRQGSPLSQWALGRYLVGRALAESLGAALLLTAVVFLGLAALGDWVLGSAALAALFVVIAVGVLLMRWVLLGVVRRLTGLRNYPSVQERMNALVAETRADVLRELRRVGLPGRVFTLPFLALRLLGRERRAQTLARLGTFETDRAVPKARLDELHLLVRDAYTEGSSTGGVASGGVFSDGFFSGGQFGGDGRP